MKSIILSVTLCLLALSSASAETRVAYTLHTYASGTSTPIESVKAGGEFDLALVVRDARPEADGMFRGVFACYANCNFDARKASVQFVQYTAPYSNGKSCAIGDNGVYEWGAFRGLGKGDTERIEVSRVRLLAKWPPNVASTAKEVTASFRPQFSNPQLLDMRQPRFNTLLYGTPKRGGGYYPGEHSTVEAGEIQATGVTLRILK